MKLQSIKENFSGSLTTGLWISPSNTIIEVATTHIDDVINNPAKFGFTSEFIQSVYDKFGEKLHQEGRAREELILLALKRGWIRVRKYRNYWSVTIDTLNDKTKMVLRDWVHTFVKKKLMTKYDELRINQMSGDRSDTLEADDVLDFKLYENAKILPKGSYSELPSLLESN